jgi:hypothetical protein
MLMDIIKRHNTAGMELLTGTVVRQLPKKSGWEIRPTVVIDVDNKPFDVKARLMMDSMTSLPKRVSFYYGGDPDAEVHLREECSSVWMIVLCVLIPLIIVEIDRRLRKKHN